jgi:hypothetical protein
MQRLRLIVLALLVAMTLAAPPVFASPSSPRGASAGGFAPSAAVWQPWSFLRQWLGGLWIDSGCSGDPLGGCYANSPGGARSAAGARQARPSTAPARGGLRLDEGCTRDPNGGCAAYSPRRGKPAAGGR